MPQRLPFTSITATAGFLEVKNPYISGRGHTWPIIIFDNTGYSFWDRLRNFFYTNLHELFCQFIS